MDARTPKPGTQALPRGSGRTRFVLAAAEAEFGEKGFAGARLDGVAARAGLQRPSLLHYFRDKDALYDATAAQILRDVADHIAKAAPDATGAAAPETLASVWVDFALERSNAARLLLRHMIDPPPAAVVETLTAAAELMQLLQSRLGATGSSHPFGAGDAPYFALIVASSSLVWVSSREAVRAAFGLDTLEPNRVEEHRTMLNALITRVIESLRRPPHA